ncbi:MAG TPA: acyl-CoA thioester hydrolase, partial [Clostridiales bacterium]|nr:acyl-CoA thioester hydrolase [Clostridiales bacterium]
MIKIKLTDKGFYGCFWPVEGSSCAMIAMIGDDCEDHLAKAAVKWFQKNFKINVMTLSPEHKNYGHSNIPVERIGAAMDYMKARGIDKFGIAGASTTGMFSLVAASYYPEITLTIAMSASDFVMEGFHRGKRDGYVEWPGEGESTLSWQGKPLPYLPYAYRHPEYGRRIKEEAKEGGDMAAARKMFDESERLHPLREEEKIKVENIKGRLLLIGAEDDVLWDTVRYMRRMEERLSRLPHDCELEMLAYEHGTHFVFPEGLIREILPLGGDLMTRLFKAGRDFPRECKATRIDIEKKVTGAI